MKNKREYLEEEILKCIKNKNVKNPFIDIADVAAHLFLLKKIGNNPKRTIMYKKYRSKKHLAFKLLSNLLKKGVIKIENVFLTSFKIK